MAERESNRCAENGRPTLDVLQGLHQQNADALNDALKVALDGAQTALDLLSEAHRRCAVLVWRGILPFDAVADAAAIAGIAAKVQLDSRAIFQRSALNGLRAIDSR
jgi:hypothetical protein